MIFSIVAYVGRAVRMVAMERKRPKVHGTAIR
jgi:hypothetical protein